MNLDCELGKNFAADCMSKHSIDPATDITNRISRPPPSIGIGCLWADLAHCKPRTFARVPLGHLVARPLTAWSFLVLGWLWFKRSNLRRS